MKRVAFTETQGKRKRQTTQVYERMIVPMQRLFQRDPTAFSALFWREYSAKRDVGGPLVMEGVDSRMECSVVDPQRDVILMYWHRNECPTPILFGDGGKTRRNYISLQAYGQQEMDLGPDAFHLWSYHTWAYMCRYLSLRTLLRLRMVSRAVKRLMESGPMQAGVWNPMLRHHFPPAMLQNEPFQFWPPWITAVRACLVTDSGYISEPKRRRIVTDKHKRGDPISRLIADPVAGHYLWEMATVKRHLRVVHFKRAQLVRNGVTGNRVLVGLVVTTREDIGKNVERVRVEDLPAYMTVRGRVVCNWARSSSRTSTPNYDAVQSLFGTRIHHNVMQRSLAELTDSQVGRKEAD